MPRIAIFCDGTWNSPTIPQPTHVVRLFDQSEASADQRTVYVPGVGTQVRTGGMIAALILRLGGGAFGWGLNDNIKQAYRALAMLYRPGDDIMIFGFSRGAYTARSLAGMIRKAGIIDRSTQERVDAAFDLYRLSGPENAPDQLHIRAQRRAMSPRFATSQADLDWRLANPDPGDPPDMQVVRIAYLGIWDTVGSLGIPASILGPIANLWNRQYRFHDTRLSHMVKAARHAVGLDERRVFFRPSLWDNLEQGPDGPGLNDGDRSASRPYQQVWFIGTHAITGGSGETRALASITLDWVAQGAVDLGLTLRAGPLADAPPDPLADSEELANPPLLYRIAGVFLAWRKGPGHPIDLHDSARVRLTVRRDYRPRSLRALMPELFGGTAIGARPPGGAER